MASHAREVTQLRSADTVVDIRNVIRRFTMKGVLNGIDLTIGKGEFVALLGRSGSGKSTLLRAIADLDREAEGSGEIYAPRNLLVAFQDARLLPWKRVLDNVILGLNIPDARERGLRALAEVEMGGRESSWPYELSGGEQQRVALARCLVREPELLLADEPFGALDALTRLRMHALLHKLAELHRPSVLLVTHDVEEAIKLADRIVILEDGRVSADIAVAPYRITVTDQAKLKQRLLELLGVETIAAAAS